MTERTCGWCGEPLPPTHKKWCSERCSGRAWKTAHREQVRESARWRSRRYRAENPESVAASKRAYYLANKERIAEYKRGWDETNREYRREKDRAYYWANRERKREYNRAWRAANLEHLAEQQRTYRERNRERRAANLRAWQRANPERVAAYQGKRHAVKSGLDAEKIDPLEIFERDCWRCQLCGGKVNRRFRAPHPLTASLDHVVPLSKGGSHTAVNVQLAHLGCNMRKGTDAAGSGEQLRLIG